MKVQKKARTEATVRVDLDREAMLELLREVLERRGYEVPRDAEAKLVLSISSSNFEMRPDDDSTLTVTWDWTDAAETGDPWEDRDGER